VCVRERAADLEDKFFKRKKKRGCLALDVVKSDADVATLFVGKTPLPATGRCP
jgi:hypothetical protein